jgi:hypothetical protein
MATEFILLANNFPKRQQYSLQVISQIMNAHEKQELLATLTELARVEQLVKELAPWARDHVVHALLSYIVGIYVNERLFKPVNNVNCSYFQWKLAGLFHDIGYPLEMASNALAQPFTKTINDCGKRIGVSTSKVGCIIVPVGLNKLQNGIDGFDLLQSKLNSWKLRIDVKKAYSDMISSGSICHGIVSSLAVLYLVDLLYQKYNPERVHANIFLQDPNKNAINFSQKYFEDDVVSSCAAIYIHNLNKEWFKDAKISQSNAPTAFLLKLSDTLQEWERPSKMNPTGYPASSFAITVKEKTLFLKANIPPERKVKLLDDIKTTLVAPNIQIL